jgi:hypothetical protein
MEILIFLPEETSLHTTQIDLISIEMLELKETLTEEFVASEMLLFVMTFGEMLDESELFE